MENPPSPPSPPTPPASAANAAGQATCADCEACCCSLEVMLMAGDDIPEDFTGRDRWGGWVMRRVGGRCIALEGYRCGIYGIRPQVCRDFEEGSPDCLAQRAHLDALPGGRRRP